MKRIILFLIALFVFSCASNESANKTAASGGAGRGVNPAEQKAHKNIKSVLGVFLDDDVIRKLSGWNVAVNGSGDVLSTEFQRSFVDELVRRDIAVVHSNHDITQEEIDRQLSGYVSDDEIRALSGEKGADIVIKLILTRTRENPGLIKVRMSAANVASNMAVASMMELLAVSVGTFGYSDIPLEGSTPHDEVRDAALAIINVHVRGPNMLPEPPKVSADMVFIKGGTFMMGSPLSEKDRDDDEVQHQVTVSSFYIGKYEVTQREYQALMGNNPSYFKGDDLPVECVSWYDAVKYCNARSQREGLKPAYTIKWENVTWNKSANGYRLPTEAEWEYACRAGTSTPYSSGNSVDNAGWYDGNSKGKTHPVGQKKANAWGLYDMHGNVCEWCWYRYGSYSNGAQNNPTGASSGSYRVLRGGSWINSRAQDMRSASRNFSYPSFRYYYLGFRLVRP